MSSTPELWRTRFTSTKTGFGVPLGRWFREDLRELARDVLTTDRGWFRPGAVASLLDEHESGRADHGHRLWCLLMLELWVREHVEAPSLVAACRSSTSTASAGSAARSDTC